MNIDTLRHFMCLAECKSISKAAKASYLSRQALTDAMNKLENELGVVLLSRTKQGITLTKEGKYFFDFLCELREPWNNMLSEIRTIGYDKKEIKIGLPQFLFSARILANIMHLVDDMPGYSILIQDHSTSDCLNCLVKNEIDIAITLDNQLDQRLTYSPAIASIHRAFLCVSTSSPLANKISVCKEDLANQLIVSVEANTMPADVLESYCKTANASLRIIPRSHTFIEEAVSNNRGYFIAPGAAYLHFDSDGIVGIPISDFPNVLHQHIILRKDHNEAVREVGKKLMALLETA